MPNTLFTIKLVGTGEVLAENLTDEQVAGWWTRNETQYFGLRVEGTDVIVDKAENAAGYTSEPEEK